MDFFVSDYIIIIIIIEASLIKNQTRHCRRWSM